MSLMTLEEITSVNPALTNSNIRIDKTTQQASVIRRITGRKSGYASQALDRHLVSRCGQHRINGKGKKTY